MSWLISFLNLSLLIGILIRYAKKPTKDFLVLRHQAWLSIYQQAKRELLEARHRYETMNLKLDKVAQEMKVVCEEILKTAENKRELAWNEANRSADEIRENAQKTIQRMTQEFRQALLVELINCSCEKAGLIFKSSTLPEQDLNWSQGFFRDFEKAS